MAASAGMAVELAIALVDHQREAWDSSDYWTLGIPAMVLAALICGFFARRNWVRIGYAPFLGQLVTMTIRAGIGSMLPLGVIFMGILGLSGALAALVGKVMGDRYAS